jgi:ATP-independent RNA helicase DbpA
MDFASLSLPLTMLANLKTLGYSEMTPIQAASLPVVLNRHDLIAQ